MGTQIPKKEQEIQDHLQLHLIGGVFLGMAAFGIIFTSVFGIFIVVLSQLRKSHKGERNTVTQRKRERERERERERWRDGSRDGSRVHATLLDSTVT